MATEEEGGAACKCPHRGAADIESERVEGSCRGPFSRQGRRRRRPLVHMIPISWPWGAKNDSNPAAEKVVVTVSLDWKEPNQASRQMRNII
jgi:hypothetical protein